MLFPEMVFESQALEIAHEYIERSDKLCSHCHRRIVGKVHQIGNRYFDSYCWQFRFINDGPSDDSDQKKAQELRTFLESSGAR